jgi:hypothetical protein
MARFAVKYAFSGFDPTPRGLDHAGILVFPAPSECFPHCSSGPTLQRFLIPKHGQMLKQKYPKHAFYRAGEGAGYLEPLPPLPCRFLFGYLPNFVKPAQLRRS